MKKLFMMFTFLSVGMFVSCTKDNAAASGQALTITPDVATHYEGESFKFTVISPDGSDVSSTAAIMVNDAPITGNTFYSLVAGTFTVKATFSGSTTKPVTITVTDNPVPLTAITVTPSSTSVYNGDVVTFTAAGNNNSALTQACTFYVDGNAITGNTFTTTTAETMQVYATYPTGTVTSATVPVIVRQPVDFQKRVLVEDYTGTWCGWCPRVAYAIEQLNKQTTLAVPVAIHVSSAAPAIDPFNFSGAQTLANTFGVSGFPTAKLNRKTTWTANEPDHIKQVTDLTKGINPRVGLAMSTTMVDGTATVNVKVKFGQDFSGLKLVVYAVEDKLIADQHNYNKNLYGGVSLIKDFQFDNVLRSCLTASILGDDITGSTNLNDEYTKSFSYTVPAGVNADNVHFVAFVVDATKKALNVRDASNNATQDYEAPSN